MALAQRAGLGELAGEHVRIGRPCGVNAQVKAGCLVAGMIAGADSIEDMGLLRHGALPALFGGIRAPSTLGSFLRAFTWGNVLHAAAATVDHDGHAGLLDDLMARVAPCFARRETRLTCRDMVHGLLSELEDHNCWTMGEAAGHPGPHRMQHLLSRARVDEQLMLGTAADWVIDYLSAGQDEDGGDVVLIVDETADEKASDGCAGAARQYSGTVGGMPCARSR